MTSIYDIHEAARDCDVEGLRRCLTPPFVRCPSTAVVTATGRHAKVLQHQSPDLLYVELDGNENAEGPAFERKTIRSSDVTVLAANPVDFRQSVGGCTALHALCGFNSSRAAMAVVKGTRNTETIEACFHMLREAGADLDARDSFGCTPLHHVAEFSGSNEARLAGLDRVWPGCLKLASLLLRHGADVHVTDRVHHASPLHSAIFCPSLTALLAKAGADVNLLDGGRRTPLYTALYRGTKYQDDRVRGTLPTLLRAGAEISSHIRYALDTFAGPHSNTDADGEVIFLYFQKVIDAGGFKKYEQAHLARLTATFAPKLRLPARPARLVAEYWGHVGYY